MSNADRSWPIRSIAAGAAGTAALTLYYDVERRLRPRHRGPLDYDDSLVPGKIVASIMHLPHVTDREDEDLGLALRWGYGSAFGLRHVLAVPASRANPAAVALAARRDGHMPGQPCLIRGRGGGRGRLGPPRLTSQVSEATSGGVPLRSTICRALGISRGRTFVQATWYSPLVPGRAGPDLLPRVPSQGHRDRRRDPPQPPRH